MCLSDCVSRSPVSGTARQHSFFWTHSPLLEHHDTMISLLRHLVTCKVMVCRYGHAVGGVYRPGELDKGQFDGPPYSVDSWGLGCLIREVFGSTVLQSKDQLRETSSLPQEVLADYKNLLHSVPTKRLSPDTVRFCHHSICLYRIKLLPAFRSSEYFCTGVRGHFYRVVQVWSW
jgi:hypothetical protein